MARRSCSRMALAMTGLGVRRRTSMLFQYTAAKDSMFGVRGQPLSALRAFDTLRQSALESTTLAHLDTEYSWRRSVAPFPTRAGGSYDRRIQSYGYQEAPALDHSHRCGACAGSLWR